MLGGVTRMTISLAVIITETIGNVTFALPLVITLIFAKWVSGCDGAWPDESQTGDLFNEGFSEAHIELRHLPILPWEPPALAKHRLRATQIMSTRLVCINPIHKVCRIARAPRLTVQVADLVAMLRGCSHSAFVVVNTCVCVWQIYMC